MLPFRGSMTHWKDEPHKVQEREKSHLENGRQITSDTNMGWGLSRKKRRLGRKGHGDLHGHKADHKLAIYP